MPTDLSEKALETIIVQSLADDDGHSSGKQEDCDREHALDLRVLIEFIRITQPGAYESLSLETDIIRNLLPLYIINGNTRAGSECLAMQSMSCWRSIGHMIFAICCFEKIIRTCSFCQAESKSDLFTNEKLNITHIPQCFACVMLPELFVSKSAIFETNHSYSSHP
jgi:hypothetical protein